LKGKGQPPTIVCEPPSKPPKGWISFNSSTIARDVFVYIRLAEPEAPFGSLSTLNSATLDGFDPTKTLGSQLSSSPPSGSSYLPLWRLLRLLCLICLHKTYRCITPLTLSSPTRPFWFSMDRSQLPTRMSLALAYKLISSLLLDSRASHA
jgi:hypothetical protein